MEFVKYNVIRKFLAPHHGKSFVEKCKILWNEGWEKSPIPTLTVVAFPFMIIHGTWEYFRDDVNHPRKMKYLKDPPIYRPGDPRIAEIQHESILDK